MTERVRWRMTLDELRHLCKVDVYTLNTWASDGALGDKYIDQRSGSGSRWRHITREMAQRAVLMSRLTHAGVKTAQAAAIARTHRVGHSTDLHIELISTVPSVRAGVQLVISREDLP